VIDDGPDRKATARLSCAPAMLPLPTVQTGSPGAVMRLQAQAVIRSRRGQFEQCFRQSTAFD